VSANDVFYVHSVSIEMSKHGMVDNKLIQRRKGNAKVTRAMHCQIESVEWGSKWEGA